MVYSFDPVHPYECEACRAVDAAQSLVQPSLDNQVNPGALFLIGVIHISDQLLMLACPPSWSLAPTTLQIYFKNQRPAPGTCSRITSTTERHIEVSHS